MVALCLIWHELGQPEELADCIVNLCSAIPSAYVGIWEFSPIHNYEGWSKSQELDGDRRRQRHQDNRDFMVSVVVLYSDCWWREGAFLEARNVCKIIGNPYWIVLIYPDEWSIISFSLFTFPPTTQVMDPIPIPVVVSSLSLISPVWFNCEISIDPLFKYLSFIAWARSHLKVYCNLVICAVAFLFRTRFSLSHRAQGRARVYWTVLMSST